MNGLLTVARYLLPGVATPDPYQCATCGREFSRLYKADLARIVAGLRPECRRRGCSGRVWSQPTLARLRASALEELS